MHCRVQAPCCLDIAGQVGNRVQLHAAAVVHRLHTDRHALQLSCAWLPKTYLSVAQVIQSNSQQLQGSTGCIFGSNSSNTPEAIDGGEPLVRGPVDGGQLRAPVVGVAVRILLLLCEDAENKVGRADECVSCQMAYMSLMVCSPLDLPGQTDCCATTSLAGPDDRRADWGWVTSAEPQSVAGTQNVNGMLPQEMNRRVVKGFMS